MTKPSYGPAPTHRAGVKPGASAYRAERACRCDECRADHTARHRRERESRHARLAADPTLAPHGSPSTYDNWGCRCRPCIDANVARCAAYKRSRRAREAQRA